MNAVLKPIKAREVQFETMGPGWLKAVAEIEKTAYTHPWTQGNFMDSLNAGYQAQILIGGAAPQAELLGYFVAMKGMDEVHLLNITVAPTHQRQGWAYLMLDALALWTRGQGVDWLWLEVRVGNTRAKSIYERYGFKQVGKRHNYYPAGLLGSTQREDALVMSLSL